MKVVKRTYSVIGEESTPLHTVGYTDIDATVGAIGATHTPPWLIHWHTNCSACVIRGRVTRIMSNHWGQIRSVCMARQTRLEKGHSGDDTDSKVVPLLPAQLPTGELKRHQCDTVCLYVCVYISVTVAQSGKGKEVALGRETCITSGDDSSRATNRATVRLPADSHKG